MAAPSGPAPSQTRTIAIAALALAAAALAVALLGAMAARPSSATPSLAMATCTGSIAVSPDEEFWKIPLDKCDASIDAIDVKNGFLTKWTVCGGAKSFEVSLNPRAVIVSSDHVHCSSTPSEASVTFIGPVKK